MTSTTGLPEIITALDYADPAAALALAQRLEPSMTRLKVGKELFTRAGPGLVEQLQNAGFQIFLDLKFHDIPHTVAGALRAAQALGVWMVNVHASGGPAMLAAAREAIDDVRSGGGTRLISVTVLTSLDQAELAAIGITESPALHVERLAALTLHAGLDGVVCSAREVPAIRALCGDDFLTITPGIRPVTSDPGNAPGDVRAIDSINTMDPAAVAADDQRRTLTPRQAAVAGSSHLVIGRPVTQAADPLAALAAIHAEIRGVQQP